jgi:hypothetical protein
MRELLAAGFPSAFEALTSLSSLILEYVRSTRSKTEPNWSPCGSVQLLHRSAIYALAAACIIIVMVRIIAVGWKSP